MFFNILKKIGMLILWVILGVYVLFLITPFILNPIINNYSPKIVEEIRKISGLNSKLEGVKIVTTPKLTAGLKINKFQLLTPKNENILDSNNFQVKMSLIPLVAKRIELDIIELESAKIDIKVKKDGSLEVIDFLPKQEKKAEANIENEQSEPINFPLILSNHLPDIKIGGYSIKITDGINNYTLKGDKTEITDFVLDKSIKVKASGKAILRDKEQFSYNIKLFNKIMPEIKLNDLVFNPQPVKNNTVKKEVEPINIIEILDGIYKNNLTANADIDLKIDKENLNGYANISNISIINLPASNAQLKFVGKKIEIDSNLYTAFNDISKIYGTIQTGKKTNVDLNFKSNIELANILKIVKQVALIFNIKDLQTLTANGKLNADFNIKSDLRNIKSNGFLQVPNANLYYGLYKIGVDNINADIVLNNNNIDIKNIGFSVLNQPLKFFGTISENAVSDLHLTADKLSLKGLLIAFGQAALMKENQVNSGVISMNADITGKLDKINPVIKLDIDNIDIKNIPANIVLKAPKTNINIISDGKTFVGTATSSNIKAINPALTISIPNIKANILENVIEITPTPVSIEKINTTVSGKIKNYLTEVIGLDFITIGDIKSKLTGDMNIYKQTLNLNYSTTEPSTIIIPMFDKSKMTFTGNIGIIGSMMNPILKGNVSAPIIDIPEIPVVINNLDAKLNGPILNGSASVQKFASGGIVAENLTTNFSLKGENFYLNNLHGTAFDGNINGNIIYNIMNAKTSVDFKGQNLNAEKAVAGAIGIKNAISGVLGFNTKLTLQVLDYETMMRSLKGNLKFNVKNGSFGNIGRIDNFFKASNIVNNTLLKTTVSTITNSVGLADTAKFDYIDGNMNFDNGWALINPIKSSGTSLAYYVTGKMNLINFTTNVNILGRLDGPIVAKLGPIGELSADKLFSYIPKFGSLTANLVNALTANPKGENISAIPVLTNGSTNYKDFKVTFNGGLESTSSIKSFKWLTDVDTSAIEAQSLSETVKSIQSSVGTDVTNTINSVKNSITTQKEEWNATKDQLKNSAQELKNLFKF